MQHHPEVKAFVQQTLGCACPEAVLEHIEVVAGTGAIKRTIRVGGRLLVYLLDADATPDIGVAVAEALRKGVSERDLNGFNRLRLVVAAADPDLIAGEVERAFSGSPERDAKTHLHLLDRTASALIP